MLAYAHLRVIAIHFRAEPARRARRPHKTEISRKSIIEGFTDAADIASALGHLFAAATRRRHYYALRRRYT